MSQLRNKSIFNSSGIFKWYNVVVSDIYDSCHSQ